MTRLFTSLAICLLSGAALAAGLLSFPPQEATAQQPEGVREPLTTSTIMDLKLDYSQQLLSGIALEDYELIAKSTERLRQLSNESNWQVFQTADYVKRSAEFRKTLTTVKEAADKKDIEGVLKAYSAVTKSCVECHQYVRSANE